MESLSLKSSFALWFHKKMLFSFDTSFSQNFKWQQKEHLVLTTN